MECTSCAKKLQSVHGETSYQFDNALWIGFFGGYAMFVDNMDSTSSTLTGTDYEAVICHECAHDLCAKVPWIEKLLNSYYSHSHTLEFWKNNPNHQGWDKESSE